MLEVYRQISYLVHNSIFTNLPNAALGL
uniref:Uncharacterized protein n=1 Tax=Rhizophora mucronata TaxID=61149 RepID=A0A2P2PJ91_RHIMU